MEENLDIKLPQLSISSRERDVKGAVDQLVRPKGEEITPKIEIFPEIVIQSAPCHGNSSQGQSQVDVSEQQSGKDSDNTKRHEYDVGVQVDERIFQNRRMAVGTLLNFMQRKKYDLS